MLLDLENLKIYSTNTLPIWGGGHKLANSSPSRFLNLPHHCLLPDCLTHAPDPTPRQC